MFDTPSTGFSIKTFSKKNPFESTKTAKYITLVCRSSKNAYGFDHRIRDDTRAVVD